MSAQYDPYTHILLTPSTASVKPVGQRELFYMKIICKLYFIASKQSYVRKGINLELEPRPYEVLQYDWLKSGPVQPRAAV